MKNLAKIFQVLSDSTRLRILKLLNLGQLSVLEFQKILKTTQSATSRHLRILREIGLIKEHRFGQSVYYRQITNSSSDNNANILYKINSFMETILKDQSFKETTRIVKEKGKIVILDFLPHHTDWYESLSRKLGFVWQGFHLEEVRLWFENNKKQKPKLKNRNLKLFMAIGSK